jgi:hypothetical protein
MHERHYQGLIGYGLDWCPGRIWMTNEEGAGSSNSGEA